MPVEPSFTYSSAPQAIKPKKKYRDESDPVLTLMSDPRVFRGPTHGLKNTAKTGDLKRSRNVVAETTMRATRQDAADERIQSSCPTYTYTVPSFVNSELDLSKYLVEDESKTKPKSKVAEVQTDKFKERPKSPDYVPRKTGIDRETQVEDVTDLFVFDLEVEPMLNVIVSKTIEQALFEVEREMELTSLEAECERYHEEKRLEQEWIRKKEEETKAEACIKELTLKGRKEKFLLEKSVSTTVAGMQCMKQLMPPILDEIYNNLFESGTWVNPNKTLAEEHLQKEIFDVVCKERVDAYEVSSKMVDELLMLASGQCLCDDCSDAQGNTDSKPTASARRTLLKVTLPGSKVGKEKDIELPPITVTESDTVSTIEKKIMEALKELNISIDNLSLADYLSSALGADGSNIQLSKLPSNINVLV